MQNNQYQYRKKNKPDTERLLGKQLPASLPAEGAVLGKLLLNDDAAIEVLESLKAEDFYSPQNKIIFAAMKTIIDEKKRIDFITLQDQLKKTDKLEAAGGETYLVSLQEDIPLAGMTQQHADLVKDKAILRSLINSATNIITNCYSQDEESISEVLDQAERTIFAISQKRSSQPYVQLSLCLTKTFKHLSNIKKTAQGVSGIPTGFKALDKMTLGFQRGNLIVLAGRPSMGKTALGLSMALEAANDGYPVGILSLEMSDIEISLRLLSSVSQVPQQKLSSLSITSDEWVTITHAASNLGNKRIFICDSPVKTILDVRAEARKLKADNNIELLVVDYLQLIAGSGKFENRNQEVSAISRSLKSLAKELDIPIIALAQLSRSLETRSDKRPILSDLRDSGAIEQDADVIMFLYREAVYNKDIEDPTLAELIVGKQRNGAIGTVPLRFVGELTKFEDGGDSYY
jgi:replicative DNA helicase